VKIRQRSDVRKNQIILSVGTVGADDDRDGPLALSGSGQPVSMALYRPTNDWKYMTRLSWTIPALLTGGTRQALEFAQAILTQVKTPTAPV
jgi:hypothetical protein